MNIIHTAIAAVAFFIVAGDAISAQSSFDCRRPRSESVSTICTTPQLAERDRQVEAAYRDALQSATEPNRVRDSHTAWANSLSICGTDRQCLVELLDEELGMLEYASRPRLGADDATVQKPEVEVAEQALPAPVQTTEEQSDEPGYNEAPTETPVAAEPPPEALEPGPVAVDEPTIAAHPKRQVADWEKVVFGGLFIIPIIAVVLALLATKSLAEYTLRRFNWPLILNWWNVLYLIGIFGGLFVGTFAGPIGGFGFLGALCVVMLIVNVSKTNLLTGLAMTAVQPFVVIILWLGYGFAKAGVQGRRS